MSVVGKSGAGKSSLLHILACLDSFDSGEYYFEGENVGSMNSSRLADMRNSKIGIVRQSYALWEGYSVLENVIFPLRFSSRKRREYRKMAEAALERVEMSEYAGKNVSELSGGQRQRVAVARAVVNSPKLLLADEPTGALDQETGRKIIRLLKDINETGTAVVIVTHDPQIAEDCGRKIILSDGKIMVDTEKH